MSFASAYAGTPNRIIFNETFGTSGFNVYTPTCNGVSTFALDNTWRCAYTNDTNYGGFSLSYANRSNTANINTPQGLWALIDSNSSMDDMYSFFSTTQNLTTSSYMEFYCDMSYKDVFYPFTNTSYYIVFTSSGASNHSEDLVLSLENGGCNNAPYNNTALYGLCEEIAFLSNISDCTIGKQNPIFNFGQVMTDIIDFNLSVNYLKNKNRIDLIRIKPDRFDFIDYYYLDDIIIYDTAPLPPITATYYEDFEDLNFTYPTPLVSYQCMFGSYSFIGTTTNPVYTTCHADPTGNTIAIGNTSILGSGKGLKLVYNYSSGSPEKTNPINFNLPTNFTITNTSYLSFDWYAIAQTWNPSGGGGYFGDAVSIFLKNPITYKVITLSSCSANSSVYLASPVDSVVSVTPHTCIINGSMWANSTLNFTFNNIQLWTRFYGDASSDELLIAIDNIQLNATTSGNLTPPVIPPVLNLTTNVFFNETFTRNTNFLFDKDNCTTTCTDDPACYQFTTPLALDNDWYCWKSDNSFMSYIKWSNISDTSKIETPQGLNTYTSTTFNLGAKEKLLQAYFPVRTFQANDTISWTCDMPYQTNGQDVYLVLGNDGGNKIVLSMGRDNTSVDRCTISGVPSGNCCELTDIVGEENDCKTNTKTKVSISESDIVSRCTNITDYDFVALDHIGLWTINQNFLGSNNYYFDDLVMFTNEARVGNNSIPIIASVTASPNPANVSQQVFWDVLAVDDDLSPDLYTAFDCEDDGVLEYSWMVNRSINGSREWIFPCSYPTTATYTARGFVSDTTYYPTITASGTGVVQIRDITEETNCDGFTAPSCSGSCSFFDDFNYANGIVCNSWQYLNRVPRGNMLVLDDLSPSEDFLQRDFSPINNWEHSSFVFSFDFIINSPDRITMTLSNTNGGTYNTYVYLYFDSGSIYALDSVTPYVTNLKSFNYGEMYTLYGLANYTSNKITYIIYNSTGQNVTTQAENFDNSNAVNSVSFSMEGAGATNFTIDNFIISSGLLNLNGTAPVNVSGANYVYNGDMFCGINWTRNPPRFSTQNCVDRGYSTNPSLSGLCLPRACLDDLGNSIFQAGTGNIFRTLVILIAIIIFAPLIILATKKR